VSKNGAYVSWSTANGLAIFSPRGVVRDISFRLRRGEILGLAGLVGSGRTETALTIFGITPATQGQILIDGQPVTITSPEAARDLGIAYIPEDRANQGLIRPQSVEDNIALANLKRLTRGIFVDAAVIAPWPADGTVSVTRGAAPSHGPVRAIARVACRGGLGLGREAPSDALSVGG
jgi:ABC-type uncharacterized transport system ATPase subunit